MGFGDTWGDFDFARGGDASNWDDHGGDKASWDRLTPEQLKGWHEFNGSGGKTTADREKYIAGLMGRNNLPAPAGPPAASAANPYTQSATPGSVTPWGRQSWSQDPTTGQWTQETSLSRPLGNANQNIQQHWADALAKPMDNGSQARDQAINAAYGQATSRLDPQWDKRQAAMKTQLLNQGLDPTSEAGKNAMQEFGQQRNDAYSSAMNGAIGQGTLAGHTAFEDNMAAYNNPAQQLAMIKALSQNGTNPGLLNATIAQKNYDLGQSTLTQQTNADTMAAGMQLAGAGINAAKGLYSYGGG